MSIDQIPLPSGDGALWLCSLSEIAVDPDAVLGWADNASTVVCLNEVGELEYRYPSYLEWLREHRGSKALWYPIRNFDAPSATAVLPFLNMIVKRLDAGEGAVMHCRAGQGRAGTLAVCLLILLGESEEEALRTVAEHRPFAGPCENSQRVLVHDVAGSAPAGRS